MTGRVGRPAGPDRMLTGPRVYRVEWLLGTDRLRGFCHCGTFHDAEDPIELWSWLLAHPDSHGGDPPARPDPAKADRCPATPPPIPPAPPPIAPAVPHHRTG